jgi:hypothetical protein
MLCAALKSENLINFHIRLTERVPFELPAVTISQVDHKFTQALQITYPTSLTCFDVGREKRRSTGPVTVDWGTNYLSPGDSILAYARCVTEPFNLALLKRVAFAASQGAFRKRCCCDNLIRIYRYAHFIVLICHSSKVSP